MSGSKEFMAVGRTAFGETSPHIVTAESFDDAALITAKEILSEQHEDWSDNIYIDLVTDKNFEYRVDFTFEVDELR